MCLLLSGGPRTRGRLLRKVEGVAGVGGAIKAGSRDPELKATDRIGTAGAGSRDPELEATDLKGRRRCLVVQSRTGGDLQKSHRRGRIARYRT